MKNIKKLKNVNTDGPILSIALVVVILSIGIYIIQVITRIADPMDDTFFRAVSVSKEFYSPLFALNHANIFHIGLNLFFFYEISRALQKIGISLRQYLLLFFAAYFGSYACTVLYTMLSSHDVITIGLSGVVFGLYSYLLVLERKTLDLFAFVIVFHLLSFFFPIISVAWWAHLGGIVPGVFLGWLDRSKKGSFQY